MSNSLVISVTTTAPVNIAVLKYWGKRDEALLLPLHTSLSATLDMADLKTTTTADASTDFPEDELWLNGKKESVSNQRVQNVFQEIRKRLVPIVTKDSKGNEVSLSREALSEMKIRIRSVNNFPTASGLASSASGYACMAFTLATLFKIPESFPGELSLIARLGSGSACRSLYGGWVQWLEGAKEDGSDSYAAQVADENHWPLDIFILVVNKAKKEVSSTSGMQTSVKTSDLLKIRTSTVVPERCEIFKKAIAERNFEVFAENTMKDSNSFHSICSDTYPPIFYLNETSKRIIHLIHAYNAHYGQLKAAYTFDAGPNAVIFVPPGESAEELKELLEFYFPVNDSESENQPTRLSAELKSLMSPSPPGAVERLIRTKVGPGPAEISTPVPETTQ